MASLSLRNVSKAFDRENVVAGHRSRRRRWRIHRSRRTVGLRQVDDAADDRRARGDQRGHDPDRRTSGQRDARRRSRRCHGVPELRALSAHVGLRQSRLWPSPPAHRQARDRAPGRGSGGDAAPRRVAATPAGAALRWPAPARRPRPCHCPPAGRLPDGRAALQSRCQAQGRHAGRARPAARRARRYHRVCHPRSGRGDDDGRPHRGDECGTHRTDRKAARPLPAAGVACSSRAFSACRR